MNDIKELQQLLLDARDALVPHMAVVYRGIDINGKPYSVNNFAAQVVEKIDKLAKV